MQVYLGNEDITGDVVSTTNEENGKTYYVSELDESGKKPFRALLDIGIKNTTTGARIFAALKGAADGGLDIPHSNKRFPGYSRDTKTFDAEVHKGHILGEHVADYMREMEEDDEENYAKHFKMYIDADKDADDLEEMYESVHASIRKDPSRDKAPAFTNIDKSYKKGIKKSYEQRRADADAKKKALQAAAGGGDEEEEEAEEDEEDDE